MIKAGQILLPKKEIDLSKYSVIACDQFTSQIEYWNQLEKLVGDNYSSLKITFPEIYLKKDNQKRIDEINLNMKKYISENLYDEIDGFILVERQLNNKKIRLGLMACIDLDDYSYLPSNDKKIKATEKTVVERLPIRVEIRKKATLELPHIMLLMNDKNQMILDKLYKDKDKYKLLYDFDLNMNGGHIKGYLIDDKNKVLKEFKKLEEANSKMVFAVGDGNHSLAAAKECWELKKENGAKDDDPAKYALCEIVSIYDNSLEFEPIHRLIKNTDEIFIKKLKEFLPKGNKKLELLFCDKKYIIFTRDGADAIKDIQDFIDEYIKENSGIEIDYIHNDKALEELSIREKCVGIFMPTIKKEELFDYAIRRGVLPRKAFSMGIAEDKRYYLEARKIIK